MYDYFFVLQMLGRVLCLVATIKLAVDCFKGRAKGGRFFFLLMYILGLVGPNIMWLSYSIYGRGIIYLLAQLVLFFVAYSLMGKGKKGAAKEGQKNAELDYYTDLLTRGVISQEEFDKKKEELKNRK